MMVDLNILLVDEDLAFIKRASDRLARLSGGTYRVRYLAATGPRDPKVKDHIQDADLVVLPSAWQLDSSFEKSLGRVPPLFWDHPLPLRFLGAGPLDQKIRDRLGPLLAREEGPGQAREAGCCLAFSDLRSQALTSHVLDRALARGRRILYLPLKPLYKIQDSFRRGPESTLGDLLCLIAHGDPPPPKDLGLWLYLHERGYFTFRLPERADDLVASETGLLCDLVRLVLTYADSLEDPVTVWLDSQDLAMEKHVALAGLCDFVYVDKPSGSSSAEDLARRELALFLARLPDSCAVLDSPDREEATRAARL